MAKPKPPRWLTQSFADGVDEQHPRWVGGARVIMHPREACQLAQFDHRRRPCEGRLERAHLVPRQRVENAIWEALREAHIWRRQEGVCDPCLMFPWERDDLILLAAWDSRNAVIGCEGHHRRLDNHVTPELRIHAAALPDHAVEFIYDWGLESEAERRFDNFIRY
jgi:hypothetical protein